jgi:curved DNA-binding protein CbpA
MLAGTGQLLVREFYEVLGVRSDAADEEIKATFRRLAKQLHPDLHPGDEDAERRLRDVIRAYETLSERPSRMAYDAGLANQRLLRRWRFRANAMTVVAAFALTVSVGLHWRVLSEAILSPGEHQALLTGDEAYRAMSGTAEGVSSSMQGGSSQAAEERGDAAPKKSPEVNAEPSYAFLDRSSAKELVDGSLAQPTTAEAPSLQSPALADQVSSDLTLDPTNETAKEGGRASREPENRPSRASNTREEASDTATPPAASLTPGTANEYQVRQKREPRAARMIRGRQLDRSSPDESGERVEGRYPARDYRDLRNQMLNHAKKAVGARGAVAGSSGTESGL